MSDVLDMPETTCAIETRSATGVRLRAFVELTKPRIAGMVLAATALGFYMGSANPLSPSSLILLFHVLLGTALVGGGANALNQYVEADRDSKMERTKSRPLPAGILTRAEVLTFTIFISLGGVVYLAVLTGLQAAIVAAGAYLLYILLYTPLKRITPWSVFVGAVPGALPPVIGWAAATESLSRPAWILFSIMFFWQLPHFAAIAWLYREDYQKGGFAILSVLDPDGSRTSMHMITHTLALMVASLWPTFYGLSGTVYAISAVVLGLCFLACGIVFWHYRNKTIARLHLRVSIIYLPLLFILMMLDKV